MQPLPEQFSQRKKWRRSARLACHLDKLAVGELQLCLQFLDSKGKLKAARCSRRLMQAASTSFAWRAATPFVVEVRSAADVEGAQTSLLRFASIHLRCVNLSSLQCVATVPHLVGLELAQTWRSPAADLLQLLQHPNLAQLQLLRLDDDSSQLLTVDAMRLIARLPQLRTFGVFVPTGATGTAVLQPLTTAPALTELIVFFHKWMVLDAALTKTFSGCAGLRRLSLQCLRTGRGLFRALCSSPNMHRLQHLELGSYFAADQWHDSVVLPDADEYRAAFSALQQLQSLTLERVWGINVLLPHLHFAPALRLLSIVCKPNKVDADADSTFDALPSRHVLSALLAAAPQLEVRLLMPATLGGWLSLHAFASVKHHAVFAHRWRELKRMGAEMERVTVVDQEPHSA